MKCGFCGKELTEGAEFCPECGMILSLGGVTNDPGEVTVDDSEIDIPEYTPNVFRSMDFEEEKQEQARELEADDKEEIAVVVEAIPEYTEEPSAEEPVIEEPSAEETAVEETEAEPEIFEAPEYDPNAVVPSDFTAEPLPVAEESEAEETEAEESEAESGTEAESPVQEEFAPPEYEGGSIAYEPQEQIAAEETEETATEEAEEVAAEEAEQVLATEEPLIEESYPAYDNQQESIPEETPTEDENLLFAALLEDVETEKLEDITPTAEKPEKKGKNSFVTIVVLIILLVGVVCAGGYVFKNVLPQIMEKETTTLSAQEADATKKPEKTTDKKETTTKEATTKETTTKETTTKETTTKESTTKETTTKETTTSGEAAVVEPSEYNVDEIPFFPVEGEISIKAGPSTSSADMISHPYGYPVYAYAKQGNYYYVHSPYLDYMGWVYAKDVAEYSEEEGTTAAAETDGEPASEQAQQSDVSYLAMINSAEGLNFRTGPGYDYGAEIVVPGGFYVRVSAVSEENPGWVYVTVEDDRYPYGTPSGWVLEEYLI